MREIPAQIERFGEKGGRLTGAGTTIDAGQNHPLPFATRSRRSTPSWVFTILADPGLPELRGPPPRLTLLQSFQRQATRGSDTQRSLIWTMGWSEQISRTVRGSGKGARPAVGAGRCQVHPDASLKAHEERRKPSPLSTTAAVEWYISARRAVRNSGVPVPRAAVRAGPAEAHESGPCHGPPRAR